MMASVVVESVNEGILLCSWVARLDDPEHGGCSAKCHCRVTAVDHGRPAIVLASKPEANYLVSQLSEITMLPVLTLLLFAPLTYLRTPLPLLGSGRALDLFSTPHPFPSLALTPLP
jgi:hypothetical protein